MLTTKQTSSASVTAEIVNPILQSTMETFSMMLGAEVKRTGLGLKSPDCQFYDITAVIGLSGDTAGSICLSFSAQTAFNCIKRMLDMDVNQIDGLVTDTVGEFANVIAGSAKDKLVHLNMELGIPNIVHGSGHQVEFPQNARPMKLEFDSCVGPFMIVFGFVSRSN